MADVIRLNHKVLGVDEQVEPGTGLREWFRAFAATIARWEARAILIEQRLTAVKDAAESHRYYDML